MNEKPIPQTPEAVAYWLMINVLQVEGKLKIDSISNRYEFKNMTKQNIFDTYEECFQEVVKKRTT